MREVGTSATKPRPSIRRGRAPTLRVVRAAGCASAHSPREPLLPAGDRHAHASGLVVSLVVKEPRSNEPCSEAALSAAVLRSIVTGGTVWLEGVAIIELAMTIWALACVASALGPSAAGLFARQEPIARW